MKGLPSAVLEWHGEPWIVEAQVIAVRSRESQVAKAAAEVSRASGFPLATPEAAGGFVPVASFRVPPRHVAILRRWAAEADALGDGLVKIVLDFSGERTLFPPGLRGLAGSLDRPFEVAQVITENREITILAQVDDDSTWHFIEGYLSGDLVELTEIEQARGGLADGISK
jgi:hypothetical protein